MAHRRSNTPGLLVALVVSLLINHGLVLPGAYLLLMQHPDAPPADPVLEVALVPRDPIPELEPPAPGKRARQKPILRRAPVPPEPDRPEKPEEKKKEKKDERKPEQVQPSDPTLRLKMVEVNNPETDLPPDNARFLSDKNRRVEQETRARHTNLVKDHPRPEPLSKPSPRREPEPGSKQPRVAEQQERPAKQHRRRAREKVAPVLVMRPQRLPRPAQREREKLAERAVDGDLPPQQAVRPERRAHRRRLDLDHRSLDRIDGEEARKQRELARLSPSTPRGRYDRKWLRVRSALENFIPEVRPGNQTALGTRAHPFALYITRMHRRIHQLWGYGFLVDLDNKADRHPMNNMRLWTMIEVVVQPDGKVEKTTIVKQSGILPYDVAALDTVLSASPYPPTPRAIRSADGKVYLHWRFHRNQRQCGTFGVDPYILTTPPKGPIDSDMAEVGTGAVHPRRIRRLNRPRSAAGRTVTTRGGHRGPTRRGRATSHAVTPPGDRDRKSARQVANRFAAALRSGDAAAMARACDLPFFVRGKKVTGSRDELQRMFKDLIAEAKGDPTNVGRMMTVMQARKTLGHIPAGADYGARMLVGRLSIAGTSATILLRQRKQGWRIFGLNR